MRLSSAAPPQSGQASASQAIRDPGPPPPKRPIRGTSDTPGPTRVDGPHSTVDRKMGRTGGGDIHRARCYTPGLLLSKRKKAERQAMDPLFRDLAGIIPQDRLITDAAELRVYECDGLPLHKQPPTAVAICASREEVIGAVRWCRAKGIPFVPRGAGTGLSGGATPVLGGLVIDTNRMRRILK